MLDRLDFARPVASVTAAQIAANVGALAMPQMTARWLQLRGAATGGGIALTLDAQAQLLDAVRSAARVVA